MATTESKKSTTAVSADVVEGVLVLSFAGGQEIKLSPKELTAGIVEQAVLHGLKQKLVDAAAISRNPDTGMSATAEDKYQAVKRVYENLLAGSWSVRRAAGEGEKGGLLYRALVEMYPAKPAAEVKAFHDGLTKAQQAALRANPKVAAIIDGLRAKDDAGKGSGVDADALLAGLGE